ncbi:MAG: PepSY domain-containing protein [Acidobacteriota bacterium]
MKKVTKGSKASFGQSDKSWLASVVHKLSSKGSRLFANDGKSIIKLLTIALLSVGVIAASLLAYHQFTKPAIPGLISKDDAIQIALKAGDWDKQTLRDKKIETTLLHVKANGFSFVVDEKTLQDTLTLDGKFPKYENQYIWQIGIIAPSNRDWGYIINAETSEILTQP